MKQTKVLMLVGLLMIAPLLGGGMFSMVGTVEGAQPSLPAFFMRVRDWNTTDLIEYDHFEFYTYDNDTQDYVLHSFELLNTTTDWKAEAIEWLNQSTLNDTINCYLWENTSNPYYSCATSLRNKAWDYIYPHANEAWEEMSALVLELLIRYFDPWDPPALTVMVPVILKTNQIGQRLFDEVDPAPQEPLIFGLAARIYRQFLRSLATDCEIGRVTAVNEGLMMLKGIQLYNSTLWNLQDQPANATWIGYIQNTYANINASLINVTKARTTFTFAVWATNIADLELSLELLRDGILDWGLRLHLTTNIGWLLQGYVSGQVVDQAKGIALSGALIQLHSDDDQFSQFTHTDANGYYSIKAPMGEYTLTVSKAGYMDLRSDVHVSPFQETEVNLAMPKSTATASAIESGAQTAGMIAVGVFLIVMIAFVVIYTNPAWKRKFTRAPKGGN